MIRSRRSVGGFDVRVWSGGTGPAALYLHGFEQHPGAASFLERLSQTREVLAPEHPGFGSSTGFERLHDIHDLIFYYRSVVEGWGRGAIDVIGHSLGGMFAAELAAAAPHLVRKLVLVAPYGLWRDDEPLPDPFVMTPEALARAKWHDPSQAGEEPSAFDAAEGDSLATFRTLNLTAASKFMWPIPDRGLARRLPYARAPTLVIHGESDGLVPPTNALAWRAALPGVRTVRMAKAGHLPMVEAELPFVKLVNEFLEWDVRGA
jgi:pimeloyl-ACP methyl ester carboxylesterase